MIKGWRGDVPATETLGVLTLILVARIIGTIIEERYGSIRFGPRRKNISKLVQVVMCTGPARYRILNLTTMVCMLFILPPA